MRQGYYHMIIKELDVPKIAFRTLYGHYRFLVLLFGVTNAPTLFMDMMNHVFQPYIDKFVVVFIDDILFNSRSCTEYEWHLRRVLQILKNHQLYAKKSKCDFWFKEITFLGHVIYLEGIFIDLQMVKVVLKWH